MSYKLMIKTHNKTGLKYLCITKKDNWEKYTGSGSYWKKHLQKHGIDLSTELLIETDDYDEFVIHCAFFSVLYDVVLSEEFANQIPEMGYESSEKGISNLEIWWRDATDEMRKVIIEKRSKTMKENHWARGDDTEIVKNKISMGHLKHWSKFTLDERREMTAHVRSFAKNFFENRENDRYLSYVQKQSFNMKRYLSTKSFEEISTRNRNSRLNLSVEAKQIRKEKIQMVYKSGKHDKLYERFSVERTGIANPAAKITVWYGTDYTQKDFKKFIKEQNLDKKYVERILDNGEIENCYRKFDKNFKREYPTLICPYCKKSSSKAPSSFKRWHFENCRMRID